MPAPAIIASAAKSYTFNSNTLAKAVADLSSEEWFKSPAPHLNHAAWIVGHCMWTRQRLLSRLGSDWNLPNLELYARGTKLADVSAFPAPDTILSAWRESSTVLDGVLNSLTDEVLATPAPPGPPSDDGKISGIVNFLAVHETYHVGQASYLRSWLGKSALMG